MSEELQNEAQQEEQEELQSAKQNYSEAEKAQIFDQEFMVHVDAMYNFAYRLTFDGDDAKDLVQDTYLKAFRFIQFV